jgi:hypothetical protein
MHVDKRIRRHFHDGEIRKPIKLICTYSNQVLDQLNGDTGAIPATKRLSETRDTLLGVNYILATDDNYISPSASVRRC